MICEDCDGELVEQTSGVDLTARRRRFECLDCGARWTWAPGFGMRPAD